MSPKAMLARLRTLSGRVVLMLTLAILPLGLISIIQTMNIMRDTRTLQEQAILAQTSQAASQERELLEGAIGAARALASIAAGMSDDPDACSAMMARFVTANPEFVNAGFINMNGVMACASATRNVDLTEVPNWKTIQEKRRPLILVSQRGAVSQQHVVIASAPAFSDDGQVFLGASSVSIPNRLNDILLSVENEDVDLLLVKEDGEVIASGASDKDASISSNLNIIPRDLPIRDSGYTFDVEFPDGSTRLAAVVPMFNDEVYVVGLWSETGTNRFQGLAAAMVPFVIWLAALVTAIFALDHLVLRHVRLLRRRMANFSPDADTVSRAQLTAAPAEMSDMAQSFNMMVDRIHGDRAQLEKNLEEKETLLREVHHRVKNNLQLIASILNMQIRNASDGEGKSALRRVQERVTNLSMIHKVLYARSDIAWIPADVLLQELVDSSVEAAHPALRGVEVTTDFEPLELDPDRAVALGHLASEALTNATRYIGRREDGLLKLSASMLRVDAETIAVKIENSVGTPLRPDFHNFETGLGLRLMKAFAHQIDAKITRTEDDGIFRVLVEFPLSEHDRAALYDQPLPKSA